MSETITIGVLAPVTGGFYYGKVLEGITREVAAVGGRVVMIQTLDAGISADEVVGPPAFETSTAWNHMDGVISIATGTQRPYLDRQLAAGRAVALASDVIDGLVVPSAVPDNAGGVAAAVDHLVEHGHTRIGFAGNLLQSDMQGRYEGYLGALAAHGIVPAPEWLFEADDNGELGGADVARRIVAAQLPVTALVAATDRNALGCLEALTDLGVAVPDELAVVGFDGIDAGAYSTPTLSTVIQRAEDVGAAAARLVLAELRGDPVERRAHVVPAELRPRGSCGCGGFDGTGNIDLDHGIDFWRNEAGSHLNTSRRRERLLREHYEIGIRLLNHEPSDATSLDWLDATDARAGFLGLWRGDPSRGLLTVAGTFGEGIDDLVGEVLAVEQFPPERLLEMSDARRDDVTIVVPVKSGGRDFGLLAIVGQVDTMSANGRETHNEWAALLTAALEQRLLHAELRTSEERYSLWAEATDDGLWDWDVAANTIYYSGRCMDMLGHEAVATIASPMVWLDAVHPDDVDRLRLAMQLAPDAERVPVDIEHRIRSRDGTYRRVSLRALPVGDGLGPAARVVGSIHDIEARKRLEEQLRRAALYDELTGLPNRKLFLDRLSAAVERSRRRTDRSYAVLFFDLDGFKDVNDTLGHLAGDLLLAETGRRLRECLRGDDLAARFGGDEFAVLLHGLDGSEVCTLMRRMQDALGTPMEILGDRVEVTASAGVATSDAGYSSAEEVLRIADAAMYRAKAQRSGRAPAASPP